MNYTLTQSLKQRALVKIATTLWNQDNIRALMAKFHFRLHGSKRKEKWQEIEDKVVEKVSHLPQPEPLKEEILGFIKPVGIQILKWKEYHCENCELSIELPNELCWTPQGIVDKKKTAEILIKDESLDITRRYRLACIYCLEVDIRELWNKMPENRKKLFYKEDPRKISEHELVVFWTYDIKGGVAEMDNMIETRWHHKCSPYQYAFQYAAVSGNKAATEYFLQKLTPNERKESLVRSAGYLVYRHWDCASERTDLPKEHHADVLCFLLSKMNEEQQIEVFKNNPYKVLKCLLDWPWQSFFMETVNLMWDFLSEHDYDRLLGRIVDKVIDGYKDCNYQKLFGEFWKQSPDANKRYVIGRCASSGDLLSNLFKIEDKKNVRLILKNATVKGKEEILFSCYGKNICESLIYSNKWDSLKFFVQECISFKDVIIKFKEEFKECIILHRSEEELEKEKDMWNKFYQLLDNLAQEYNKKRSMEEGESSLAKRLNSTECMM